MWSAVLQVLSPDLPYPTTSASPEEDAHLAEAAVNAPLPEPLLARTVTAMLAAIRRRAAWLPQPQQKKLLAVSEGGSAAQMALTNNNVRITGVPTCRCLA